MAPELSVQIGSDAWTSGTDNGDDGMHDRIKYFKKNFNENSLLAYASSLRNHKCTLSTKFSMGYDNLVKKITYDDGVEWVARIKLPFYEDFNTYFAPRSPSKRELDRQMDVRTMESEVAIMEFIRLNTTIPVPIVHGYNSDHENPVGFPYLIMDYVPGTTAKDLANKLQSGKPYPHYHIPEVYEEKFFHQLASIMVELASLRVPKIGSIIKSKSGCFTAGPLANTGSGPYNSAAEFNDHYAQSILKSDVRAKEDLGEEAFVTEFRKLALTFRPSNEEAGFGIFHGDLGPHNVIVDNEFNILSVIDWDGAKSVPDAYLGIFPKFLGLNIAPPGRRVEFPFSPRVREFESILGQEGRKRKDQCYLNYGIASRETRAYQLLATFPNNMAGQGVDALKWLGEHDTADLARYYHL